MNSDAIDPKKLVTRMQSISQHFRVVHGVSDIWSNSKIYEVIIANVLGHQMIPGHSGSLDAKDQQGREYEYKHFKQLSSNHSWTFNDFSDSTIAKLKSQVESVVFAHIDDENWPPAFDWAYLISGSKVAEYLEIKTKAIKNSRRMINISEKQLAEENLGTRKLMPRDAGGIYSEQLGEIFDVVDLLERATGVSNIMTSNKFWEYIVSVPLGHKVNSEQGGRAGAHDASNNLGEWFEYKVSSKSTWNFQDISDKVLDKYFDCKEFILAVVDKSEIHVINVFAIDPTQAVPYLKAKRDSKAAKYSDMGKEVRRHQVTLSMRDLRTIGFRRVI